MDKALDFGSKDCRFESCYGRGLLLEFFGDILSSAGRYLRIVDNFDKFFLIKDKFGNAS